MSLAVYLLRAGISRTPLRHTHAAYFNYLADAFLHGQLSLRLPTEYQLDLVHYAGKVYLYWPPFPAVLVMPLVALFGVGVSDVAYTAAFGAIAIALTAKLLAALDETGIAPLDVERRAVLVATVAFGSVALILAPRGEVWYTSQIVGWGCVLAATVAALAVRGRGGYVLVGLAFACATATRVSLLFNGLWLAYYLLRRDRREPLRWRLGAAACALAPIAATLLLLGWYNLARFGRPLEMGIPWHNMDVRLRADYARYGYFSLHYLPDNLYFHFVASPLETFYRGMAGGLFWMTPVLLGAPYALWRHRRGALAWAIGLTCALVYLPIGLLMSPGNIYGPRYLLDLLPPLLVLTALGIRRWRLDVLHALLLFSCAVYAFGSALVLALPFP
jgi:hypothetical protein